MATRSSVSGTFVLFAISLFIVESVVSILIALLGIQVQECKINPFLKREFDSPENLSWWETVYYLTYLTYFRNTCSWFRLSNEWSHHLFTVCRTYKWFIIYLILSGFWMLTSLLMFVAVKGKQKINRRERIYFFYPWILITVAVIIVDTLASLQYLFDTKHASDTSHYFQFIGFKGNCSTEPKIHFSIQNHTLSAPPILMALIFSRGVILWILNALVVIFMCKMIRYSEGKEEINNKTTETISNQYQNVLANEDLTSQSSAELSTSTTAEQNYVPWMNVLYLPSICEEATDATEATMPTIYPDEHQYEHQYEHVTCPTDLPNTINIQLPQNNDSGPLFNRMTPYYQHVSEPKLLKIDIGNFSIQIRQKIAHPGLLSTNYHNTRVKGVQKPESRCSSLNCRIHHENNDTIS